MKEKDLINQYKRQMKNRSEEPPADAWNNIANELDIDEVWGNISEELDADEQKRVVPWFWIRTAAAVLLIASTFSLAWWFTSQENNQLASENNQENAILPGEDADPNADDSLNGQESDDNYPSAIERDNFIVSGGESDTPPNPLTIPGEQGQENENNDFPVLQESNSILANENRPLRENQPNNNSGSTGNTEELINSLSNREINKLALADARLQSETAPQFIDLKAQDKGNEAIQNIIGNDFTEGTFALGLSTAIKNTWMLNQETIDGLDRLNHNQTDVTFYPDLGLSFRYKHNSRWSLETDLFLSSSTGQSYRQYINGKYTIRDISLRYFQSELTAGYSFQLPSGAFNRQIIAKPVAGIYFSYLYSAREKRNDASLNVMNQYQNADYGIMAGHHFDISIARNFVFSPGLRIKWGLSDIYKGTDDPSAFSDQTHNRSFEFRLNFYYHF